ncbi:retrotransposon protein [Artemisia annua]|uniref:Retrotransposon protein n=1 Tax=Artemisia annua TaxID=35608 RepID=A0A2U1MCK7_ARTAN|nr:retrotransposon protein [Artemisia annua]
MLLLRCDCIHASLAQKTPSPKAKHVNPSKTKVQAPILTRRKKRSQYLNKAAPIVDPVVPLDSAKGGDSIDIDSSAIGVSTSTAIPAETAEPVPADDITMDSADQPSAKSKTELKMEELSARVAANLTEQELAAEAKRQEELKLSEISKKLKFPDAADVPKEVSTDTPIPADSTPLVDEGTQSASAHEVPKADSVPPEPSISAEPSIPPNESAATEGISANEEAYFSAAEEATLTADESKKLDTADTSHPSTTEVPDSTEADDAKDSSPASTPGKRQKRLARKRKSKALALPAEDISFIEHAEDDGEDPELWVSADSPRVSADLPAGSVSIDTAKGKGLMIEESLPFRVKSKTELEMEELSARVAANLTEQDTQPSITVEGTQSASAHEVPKADSVPPEPSISAEPSIPPNESAATEGISANEEAYFSAAEEGTLTADESEKLDIADTSHPSTTEVPDSTEAADAKDSSPASTLGKRQKRLARKRKSKALSLPAKDISFIEHAEDDGEDPELWAQQLTGHLEVKHCFGAGRESDTKSRQTLNNRYDLKLQGSRSASETMGDKLPRREGNSPDHQLRPLNERSVIKEVGVQRQPGGLPRSSHP